MKKSKAIELFMALGLAASVAACGGAPEDAGTTEEPAATEEAAPAEGGEDAAAPATEEAAPATEGGEGGEG